MEFVTGYGQNSSITTCISLDTLVSPQAVGALSSNSRIIQQEEQNEGTESNGGGSLQGRRLFSRTLITPRSNAEISGQERNNLQQMTMRRFNVVTSLPDPRKFDMLQKAVFSLLSNSRNP